MNRLLPEAAARRGVLSGLVPPAGGAAPRGGAALRAAARARRAARRGRGHRSRGSSRPRRARSSPTSRPTRVLSAAPRVRFVREGAEYLAIVPFPNADPHHLDVVKVDDELTITTGSRRRSLKLPRRFVPLGLAAARLDGPSMKVAFSREAPAGRGRLRCASCCTPARAASARRAWPWRPPSAPRSTATGCSCSPPIRRTASATPSAVPVGPRPVEVAPNVVAQEVAALAELDRSWSEIQQLLPGAAARRRRRDGGRGAARLPRNGGARRPAGREGGRGERGVRRLRRRLRAHRLDAAACCGCPTCCASSWRTSST